MALNPTDLTNLCKRVEAFETATWAIEAILAHELMNLHVVDPCVGKGRMARAARELGHEVFTMDIVDWADHFPGAESPDYLGSFMQAPDPFPQHEVTYFMNPPFKKASAFVDRAKANGAYKIICFQTFVWRSSDSRAQWWEDNPPSRIWLCVDRASCFRFDIPATCPVPERCDGKGARHKARLCLECMNSTPTTHAFFVWERGHRGTTINDLHKAGKKSRRET